MSVGNTTGARSLFISWLCLASSAAYAFFCRHFGKGRPNGLIRRETWYGVDISMVLNALIRGSGKTPILRLQLCTPPMPTRQVVFKYLDQWYSAHALKESYLVFVFDGRRCPHKKRRTKQEGAPCNEIVPRVCVVFI